MKWITLLTDFGLEDGYPGIMKGVIWGIAPGVRIADLSHTVSPQDILGGALVLERAAPYFPAGTVHIGVVDPGVGTHRRPIAAQLGDCFFVGPDNGLCTPLLHRAEAQHQPVNIVHLTNTRYWLAEISSSFHGRDIFAPVGAHLANGISLKELGETISDPLRLEIPQPQPFANSLRCQVIHIDHFGNIATSIRREHLEKWGKGKSIQVRYKNRTVIGLAGTFGEGESGELVALFDSSGYLALCLKNGNAASLLGAKVGDTAEIIFTSQPTSQ